MIYFCLIDLLALASAINHDRQYNGEFDCVYRCVPCEVIKIERGHSCKYGGFVDVISDDRYLGISDVTYSFGQYLSE